MRWVKETLPPRVRRRWLLITMRLSASSLAGTARTLVAVGMVSDRSMFLAITALAPRIGLTWSPSVILTGGGVVVGVAAAGAGFVAAGCGLGCAGARTAVAAVTWPLSAFSSAWVRALEVATPWLAARGVGL